MSLDEYKLSAELRGHSLDVRSVACAENFIVSGSRDKTAKVWEQNNLNEFVEKITLRSHINFVSSVCVINNGKWICTGSNDSTICIYTAGHVLPFATLRGHSATVSALAPGHTADILVSGSWDYTARIWTIGEYGKNESIVLQGHEAAVWAVVVLPNGKYITGSADKTIIYWNTDGERLKTLKGHKDCVRGLLALPDNMLASVGNDAVIKIWDEDGEYIRDLSGHTNYIYSIALNPALGDNVFVTCGEDSTVRMWNINGPLGEAITLPAESIWSIACLLNGDIVTGTSDGLVRVFTRDAARIADENTIAAFNAASELRQQEANAMLGGVKVTDLPGPEALLTRGREDQTKMIRHPDGKVICYQWASGKWNPLGDVIGAAGGSQSTSGKNLFEGKEYDYVFSVDISDLLPPLKLPYNNGDDPYVAAQNFIHKHELPQTYLDEVANFIIKNAAANPIAPNTQGYRDPFTGGSRYVPGSDQGFNSNSGNVDPFTGGASYTTSFNQAPVNVLFNPPTGGGNADPFTGGSSYSTTRAGTAKKVTHFPYSQYSLIDACDPGKVLIKLKEFNGSLGEIAHPTESLDVLVSLCNLNETVEVNGAAINLLKELLLWPSDKLFPVLDILRMAIRDQSLCNKLITPHVLNIIIDNLNKLPANQLMSVRCLSNMMVHDFGRKLVETSALKIVCSLSAIRNGNANLQFAVATFLLNLSVTQTISYDQNICQQISQAIVGFINWVTDLESIYRSYRALGNILTTACSTHTAELIISTDNVANRIRDQIDARLPVGYQKVNEISQDIISAL